MKESSARPPDEPTVADAPAPGAALDAVERRLAALAAGRESLGVHTLAQGLADAEESLGRIACRLGEVDLDEGGFHPVVDVAQAWEERLRRAGEADAAHEVGAFVADRVVRDLRRRERLAQAVLDTGAGPTLEGVDPAAIPGQLFLALVRTEELRRRVEGRAVRIGHAVELDSRTICDEALATQRRLRGALEVALEAAPPDEEQRQDWADRLVDLADETLLEAAEANDRRRGARILGETANALEWHLGAVETRARRGPLRTRLRRRARKLRAARVESELEAKLEARFGARRVRAWDRAVLVALVVVLVLLVVGSLRGDALWMVVLDTAVCALFLVDFFVRAALVRFHPLWLRRHFVTDFLPALPYGLLAWLAPTGEAAARGAGSGRFLRKLAFAKYIRALLPLIRILRAFSFLMRGLDRLVARHARELETKLLFFPSPEERRERAADEAAATPAARYWRIRGDLDGLYESRLEFAGAEERALLARTRFGALQTVAQLPVAERPAGAPAAATRTPNAPIVDEVLLRLASVRSEELEGRVGTEAVKRIARGARLLARSPLRFVPVIGRWAPPEAAELPERRAASRTVRRGARTLHRLYERVLWWADLKGAVTPSELVGRFGSALVARTSRPAVRLLLFGGAYAALSGLLWFLGIDSEGDAANGASSWATWLLGLMGVVKKIVGAVLIVLGSVALVLMALGVWLQRLAKDTTTFLERVARAQFLHLTDSIKSRWRDEDAELVARRVFRLERNLLEQDGAAEAAERDQERFARHFVAFVSNGVSPPSRTDTDFDPVARAVMLYRDFLDGALLAESDTRATAQILGNLALQRAVTQSGRLGKRFGKGLRRLDLERRNTLVRGPYPWFHAITRALSSRAARHIVDYNRHAIPLHELDRVGEDERARYERWLHRLPSAEGDDDEGAPELTTSFTVLHFLDASPARDAEVAARFGDEVLVRLRTDRRTLIRTVFGTYPLHEIPRESRFVSAKAIYDEWVGGGRVLLVPLRAAWIGVQLTGRFARALVRAVSAIRDPRRAEVVAGIVLSDAHAALRKIDRMRAPAARAALRLRAVLDPEYLGLSLPLGLFDASESLEEALSPARRDARYLRVSPCELDELAALETRSARLLGHIERLAGEGLVERLAARLGEDRMAEPTTLRALVTLLVGDVDGLRIALLGREVLAEAVCDALEFGLPRRPLPSPTTWLRTRTFWRGEGATRLVRAAQHAGLVEEGPRGRRRVRRALGRVVQADVDGARAALASCLGAGDGPAEAEERLAEILRHPARISEQLVTLRIVQTLSIVDVRNYRRHVLSLAQYDDPDAQRMLDARVE